MSEQDDALRVQEAYKQVIEFNKTIITLSSGAFTALTAYLIYQKIEFNRLNYLSFALLFLSILLSIMSLGGAIKPIKTGVSNKLVITFANIGGYLLLGGLGCLILIKKDEKNIDGVLKKIESTTTGYHKDLAAKNCTAIEFKNNAYILHYKTDSTYVDVTYSLENDKIISVK